MSGGTAKKLGRDPHQHLVHESVEVADKYIGNLGVLTMVFDAGSRAISQLRAHNGTSPGGSVLLLSAPGSTAALLPNASVLPVISITAVEGVAQTINHQLGYQPLVAAFDANGVQVGAQIVHDDLENVSLTFDADGVYTVYLR